jgi:tellurite resistance protein TerC
MNHLLAAGASADAGAPLVYAGFVAVVLAFLALDLGVFHRRPSEPGIAASIGWTAVWVAAALCVGVAIAVLYEAHAMGLGLAVPVLGSPGQTMVVDGWEAAKLYITAYLVEKSLSIDNVFVIAMIFGSLGVPATHQHRVLFWGILGALVMRGAMIGLGAGVIGRFSWVVYVFGAVLVVAAVRMALARETGAEPGRSWGVRLLSRVLPIRDELDGQKLLSKVDGRWHGTRLLVALVVIETTDLTFAVDSIPAVYAITGDPFLVFTSNIMAILGLRSLYFCLASAMTRFRYLRAALVGVLLFVGVKMFLIHTPWKTPPEVSLGVVVGLLASGVAASVLVGRRSPGGPGGGRHAREVWAGRRFLRRVSVLTAGSAMILAGLALSPLPGPQLSILGPLGLGLLASEFLWARHLASRPPARSEGCAAP